MNAMLLAGTMPSCWALAARLRGERRVVDGLGELLLLVGQRPGLPLQVLQLVDP